MDQRKHRIWLLVVLAIACGTRLGAILGIDDPQTVPRTLAESDAPTYYVLADNLLSGTGYKYGTDLPPTAKRTPGYPLFIASVFRVFGRSFNAVRGVQCVLEIATTYMVFLLCLLLFQSHLVAILASLGYALYPPSIISTTYIMTEPLYAFFLLLFVVSCVLAVKARNYPLYMVSGIALGLATLTRPGVFLLPIAMLAVALLARPATWRGFVVLLLAFCVTMLPWAVRNKRELGKMIPTSTLIGANLYKGNHLPTQGAYFWSTDSLLTPDLRSALSGATEAQRDSLLRAEAMKMIRENKKAIATLTLKKMARLWLNLGYGRSPSKKSLAIASVHLILIGLGVYGFSRIPSPVRYLSFVPLTTIIFSSAMYLAVASEVRFVFPLIPLLLPYSSVGFVALIRKVPGG